MEIFPSDLFFKSGKKGPSVVMTDDSNTEKQVLKSILPNAIQLLCTFHFLQCRWTWLYEERNRIGNQDRAILLNLVKVMVYAKTETQLESLYKDFKSHITVQKYMNFFKHIGSYGPNIRSGHCALDQSFLFMGVI